MYDFLCTFCGVWFKVDDNDLGAEDIECPTCGSENCCPETLIELEAQNKDYQTIAEANQGPTTYRVMFQGEDGVLSCLKNNVPEEYADLVCKGYQADYTEGQKVFLEPETSAQDYHRIAMMKENHFGEEDN